MKKTPVREQLVGKPLIGFDTKAGAVRAPRSKVGGGEIKTGA